MKIKKAKKLVDNLQDKTEYIIHIRNLKQAINHGLVLKKVQVIFQRKKLENNWITERWVRWLNHEKIFGLRSKIYSCSKDNNNEGKKATITKKCFIKRRLKFFRIIKSCL